MSLYKRKDSPHWWIKLSHRGRGIQQSSGTADADKAREYHDKLKAALWDEVRLGVKPKRSWKEAVLKYVGETNHKASHKDDLLHFKYLDRFLEALLLSEIDRAVLDRITAARRKDGVSNASVNRLLGVVQRVLRRAVYEWEWLDRCPKVRMLDEPSIRIRWLKPEEARRLLAELPEHLAVMARFSLETGLRRANVVWLKWENVDLVRRRVIVHADEAKGRRNLTVPLTDEAIAVIRGQIGKHLEYVFP
jgi:integrase